MGGMLPQLEPTPALGPRRRAVLAARRLGYRAAFRAATAWWFVARPHTQGVKVLVRDGDLALFVRHSYGEPVWEVPGGGIDPGEAAPDAATREVREELGLAITAWQPLGVVVDRRRATAHLECFSATYDGSPLRLAAAELVACEWWPVDHPPQPLGRHAARILALAAEHRAGVIPPGGR